jgi:hypothetical protein
MPRITVSRQSRDDIGQREVFVSLDGEEMAILRHGESVTREVAPGAHRLRVHNTLFRKMLDVQLADDEDARFRVVNKAGWGTYGIASVLGAGPIYLTVERESTSGDLDRGASLPGSPGEPNGFAPRDGA